MQNMELSINGTTYEFKFGFGFMRDLDGTVQVPVPDIPGKKEKIGLKYCIAQVLDGDINELLNILDVANKGMNPRLNRAILEEYIESDACDVDALFEMVIDFLSKANVTRKVTGALLEAMEKQKQ